MNQHAWRATIIRAVNSADPALLDAIADRLAADETAAMALQAHGYMLNGQPIDVVVCAQFESSRNPMTYQFTAQGATKADAKKAVADQFDNMMGAQPVHSKDRAAAIANASAVIDLLADDETKGVQVTLNGYVSWQATGLNAASVSATATHIMLPAA